MNKISKKRISMFKFKWYFFNWQIQQSEKTECTKQNQKYKNTEEMGK